MPIKLLQNNEVDKQQWDDCINQSPNGLLYATSIYLDNMCPGWEALSGENYDWVMPLTAKSKFSIAYLYQPPFTQQLGVFAKHALVHIPWQQILETVNNNFKFWQYNFNYQTPPMFTNQYKVIAATNYILYLNHSYNFLQQAYKNDLNRNLRKSLKYNLSYEKHTTFETAVDLYVNQYGIRMPHIQANAYIQFKNLLLALEKTNQIVCRQVCDVNNNLLAIVLLLKDNKRIYNLMNSTTDAGRQIAANHFLMDSLIKEFAGQDLILDFEGSDLPGVKPFYENFGAVDQPYFMVTYNNLPWPLRLFKH